MRIGIVGCGNISGIYFENCAKYAGLTVVACADLDLDRARRSAETFGIPKATGPEDLLANPDVELVLNLTIPKAHGDVGLAALRAGKHVYNEKPLAATRGQVNEMVALAASGGLRIGGAPDTFLGGAHQTCRKLIDDGAIGEPVAAQAYMLSHGHETWHPSPEFFYQLGGGPMFDMGPYYVTALVNMIGGVKRVTGSVRASFPTRTITTQPKAGQTIQVEIPTHLVGVFDFGNGAIGEIATSFDVWHGRSEHITVYGREGSLAVPDPNGFGGEVLIRAANDPDWRRVPLTHGFRQNSRGVGVLDMATAIRTGRPHRASGELTAHVFEVMQAVIDSSDAGRHIAIEPIERPAAFAPGSSAEDALPE